MKTLAIAALMFATATSAVSPTEVLRGEAPSGFDLASDPPTELTFEQYAPLSPEATAHVDAASATAATMRAAVDVWASDADDILLREVTSWATEADADAFVEQAAVVGAQNDLDATEAPFDGGVAFIGADDGLWTRTLTWRQGRFAVTIAHFAIAEGTDQIIGQAGRAIVDEISERTGASVAGSGSTAPQPEASTAGGGIPILPVLLVAFFVGGAIILFMRMKNRRAAEAGGRNEAVDDEAVDVDDIIERARARGRAEREVDAIPDPSTEWTPPDDY